MNMLDFVLEPTFNIDEWTIQGSGTELRTFFQNQVEVDIAGINNNTITTAFSVLSLSASL